VADDHGGAACCAIGRVVAGLGKEEGRHGGVLRAAACSGGLRWRCAVLGR
jgi:hypothetical protein